MSESRLYLVSLIEQGCINLWVARQVPTGDRW